MADPKSTQDEPSRLEEKNIITVIESLPAGVAPIATRGKNVTLYVRPGVDPNDPKAFGIMEDRNTGSIIELPIVSAMNRGYWEVLPPGAAKRMRPKPQLPKNAESDQ